MENVKLAARWLLRTLLTICLLLTGTVTVPLSAVPLPEPTVPQVIQVPLANGFVQLSFHPPALHVPLGETRSGYVNVSIDDNAVQDLPVHIYQCCEDPAIAIVTQRLQHFVVRNQSAVLKVEARGTKLGRTSLRFYVARNDTAREGGRRRTYGPGSGGSRNLGDQSASADENSSPKTSARDAAHRREAKLDRAHEASPQGPSRSSKKADSARYRHVGTPVTEYPPSPLAIATLIATSTTADSNADPGRESASHVKIKRIENSKMAAGSGNTLPSTTPSGLPGGKPFFGNNNHPNLSQPEGTEIWWIPTEYEVLVSSPLNPAGPYLSYAVMILVGLNMLGVGAQVDGEEVSELLKKPLSITVGFFCRFAVIPALGLGLVELMQPSAPASLGVLTLTCSPAEGASTLLVLLAELDLTFSVTLTAVNNFATIGMIPLWTIVFENRIYDSPGNVHIPFREIFVLFGYMTCALALGLLGRKKSPSMMFKYWTYLPSLTVFTVVVILIVEIYNNYFVFSLVTASVFFQSTLLAVSGFLFSGAMAFIVRQPHDRIAVIAIETGTRTTYITTLLLSHSLPKPEGDVAKTAPVLCAFLSLLPAFFVVLVYRMLHRYRKVKYAATTEVSYLGSVEDVQELCKAESEMVDSKETAI